MSDVLIEPFVPPTDAVCPFKSKVIDEIVAKLRAQDALKELEERKIKLAKLYLQSNKTQVKTDSND
jgi:hypothetical protein